MSLYVKNKKLLLILTLVTIGSLIVVCLIFIQQRSAEKEGDVAITNTSQNIREVQPKLPAPMPKDKLEEKMMTLEEARKKVPYEILLPSYLPTEVKLKGVALDPPPPGFEDKYAGEIILHYTNDIRISEFPTKEPYFDVEARLREEKELLQYRAPDQQGKCHSMQKITINGKIALGREGHEQVIRGETKRVPTMVIFEREGSGDFKYVTVLVEAENLPLEEAIKIAESIKLTTN